MKFPSELAVIILVSLILHNHTPGFSQMEIPNSLKYLGETPPGKTAKLFYGGNFIENAKDERRCFNVAFSPHCDEMFFSYYKGTEEMPHPEYEIQTFKLVNNAWVGPTQASFSGTFSDVDINYSPDGKYVFFASSRKFDGLDIFFSTKTDGGWSEPVFAGGERDSSFGEVLPSLSQKGNLFFRSSQPGGISGADIYRAEWVDEKIKNIQNLGPNVNSPYGQTDPAIAPDESYVLFVSSRPEIHNGAYLIYVSFQTGNNEWTKAVRLGPQVNSEIGAGAPTISPDGKYLFFKKRRGDDRGIYWISTQVIEEMRDN